jgi:uncharacterized low-complexity protein
MAAKRSALVWGSCVAISLAAAGSAVGNPFSLDSLEPSYRVAGADEKKPDGKCGEGKCGGSASKTGDKKADGKCGEGKCGASPTQTGEKKVDGKCGEGKCGARK